MPVEHKHPWHEPEEVKIPTDFLERPSTKAVLDAIRILRNEYGERVAIVGKVMGPWTLAYHTHGTQDFLMKTILEPNKIHRFLDRLKEITLLFGTAQIHAGADVLCLADHATGDLVSPRAYRDFLLPYHQGLAQKLGCPTVLHICGNTYDRLDDICLSGFDAFHFDSKVDAKLAVDKVAGRISLIGNINNPQILLNATPEEVEEKTRATIMAGVNIVGPECAIPLQTPLENRIAINNAAR